MTDFLVRRDDLRAWRPADGEERAAEAAPGEVQFSAHAAAVPRRWLIASQLAAEAWHGAGVVVLTSASSRTAYATAAAIREHDDPPKVVGLTSSANMAFTTRLGLYDTVLT